MNNAEFQLELDEIQKKLWDAVYARFGKTDKFPRELARKINGNIAGLSLLSTVKN